MFLKGHSQRLAIMKLKNYKDQAGITFLNMDSLTSFPLRVMKRPFYIFFKIIV